MIIETTVAPVIPSDSFHGGICQSGRQEGRSDPCSGNGRTGHASQGWRHVGFVPGGVASNVRTVRSTLELFHAFSFVLRIQGSIAGDVQSHTSKNEEKRVCNKGGGRFRKAERFAKSVAEDGLRSVIGDCQASGNADNVLGAGAPKVFGNFATKELVEVSVIHL